MAKNKKTESAADRAKDELIRGQLASILSGGQLVYVDPREVIVADNTRSDVSQAANVSRLKPLMLAAGGYAADQPVTISKRADGSLHTVRGNCRTLSAADLAMDGHRQFESIPAIVMEGLDESQEILLRADHGSSESAPLDAWGEFLQVRQLGRAGLTQLGIAEQMGLYTSKGEPNRSYVQIRSNLGRLPQFVQDEFEILWAGDGKDATKVRQADISDLYTALYGRDKETGEVEFPSFPDGSGPKFSAAWKSIQERTEDDTDKPKALTAKQMQDCASNCGSAIVRGVFLQAAAGTTNVIELDSRGVKAEAALAAVDNISKALGPKLAKEFFAAIAAKEPVSVTIGEPVSDVSPKRKAKVTA